ncbi:MAG TPA: hypothetical protein VHV51_18700 [Polyangiaceae bacterium]|nr:hypothetical protein [Polyangiaceae bacterium]
MASKKMRGTYLFATLGASLLGFIAYSSGCSLPDRTYVDDTAGNANGGGGNSTSGGSTSAGNTSTGGNSSAGTSPTGEGGEAGATGGQPGLVRPVPTKGLIVIGGTELDETKGVISAISPLTGKELLTRESLPAGTQVAEIGYDGADKKDVWYIFIGTTFPAGADKVVDLQVRYFADDLNEWITLSKVTTLPAPVPGTMTVLNDRLAYLSHVVVNNVATPALTILDTTDVLNVKTIAASYTPMSPFTGDMVTLIGTRGTAADATGTGGTLDLGLKQPAGCTTGCNLFVQPIPVGDTIGSTSGHVLGAFQGTPVAYASRTQQLNYFALSPETGNVQVYYSTPDAPESAISFDAPQKANDLVDLTVAECQNTAAATANSENALYAVTLGAGAGVNHDLGRPGQIVAYEPFQKEVITTYNPPTDDFMTAAPDGGIPGPDIKALDIVSTGGATLKVTERTVAWAPPTDLRANVLETRFPVPFTCK